MIRAGRFYYHSALLKAGPTGLEPATSDVTDRYNIADANTQPTIGNLFPVINAFQRNPDDASGTIIGKYHPRNEHVWAMAQRKSTGMIVAKKAR
jgi:hypothetical protein